MNVLRFGAAALWLSLAGSCGLNDVTPAAAEIRDREGTTVGAARFEPQGENVKVTVEVAGLPPGRHGIHVHEAGRCDPPDFMSAGAHFNPGGQPHHGTGADHHAGDLPNLQVAADGRGRLQAILSGITTRGRGHHSLFHVHGTSIVIHREPDDLSTSPSGNSGERVACGVIVAERPGFGSGGA